MVLYPIHLITNLVGEFGGCHGERCLAFGTTRGMQVLEPVLERLDAIIDGLSGSSARSSTSMSPSSSDPWAPQRPPNLPAIPPVAVERSRPMAERTVLICGAGIAGPALAFWLKRYGLRPVVVERAPDLRSAGPRARSYERFTAEEKKDLLRRVFADAGWEVPRVLARLDDTPDFYFDAVGPGAHAPLVQGTGGAGGRLRARGRAVSSHGPHRGVRGLRARDAALGDAGPGRPLVGSEGGHAEDAGRHRPPAHRGGCGLAARAVPVLRPVRDSPRGRHPTAGLRRRGLRLVAQAAALGCLSALLHAGSWDSEIHVLGRPVLESATFRRNEAFHASACPSPLRAAARIPAACLVRARRARCRRSRRDGRRATGPGHPGPAGGLHQHHASPPDGDALGHGVWIEAG